MTTIATKVRIGVDQKTLGTVELTDDGLRVTGETPEATQQINSLLSQMRRGFLYGAQTDGQFLADLPNRLRSRTWAVDASDEADDSEDEGETGEDDEE